MYLKLSKTNILLKLKYWYCSLHLTYNEVKVSEPSEISWVWLWFSVCTIVKLSIESYDEIYWYLCIISLWICLWINQSEQRIFDLSWNSPQQTTTQKTLQTSLKNRLYLYSKLTSLWQRLFGAAKISNLSEVRRLT